MKDEQLISEFLIKYSENRHTEQEHELFMDWLYNASAERVDEVLEEYQRISEIAATGQSVHHTDLFRRIEAKLDLVAAAEPDRSASSRLWPKSTRFVSIAAACLIAVAFILMFSSKSGLENNLFPGKARIAREDTKVTPERSKVTLELGDGSNVVLDHEKVGLVATEPGSRILKVEEGHIVYSSTASSGKDIAFNTLFTPKGGTYMITLPDGTNVWLNATSSLKFPTSFNAEERKVELIGEAYFEVAKQPVTSSKSQYKPFYVVSKGQTVEVLGTHFNVKSYPDEVTATTTLLEGSVRVSKGAGRLMKVLKPGQQSKVNHQISVEDVDAQGAIAWKMGHFNFANENIEDIMRNLTRWYDVEVKYEKNITRERFVGSISRPKNIRDVLEMLEMTGAVRFKVEGRRITVMN